MKHGHSLNAFGTIYIFNTIDTQWELWDMLEDFESKEEFEAYLAAEEVEYETSSND